MRSWSRARRSGATEKYIVREAHTKKEEIALLEYGFEWSKTEAKPAYIENLNSNLRCSLDV